MESLLGVRNILVGPLPLSLLGPVHASVCLIDHLNSRAEGREFMPTSRVDIFLEIVSGFVLIFAQASGSWVSPFAWKLWTLGCRREGGYWRRTESLGLTTEQFYMGRHSG